MSDENAFDIFNQTPQKISEQNQKSGGTSNILYKPDPNKGSDNVYQATVRFLPNINDPENPYIKKFMYFLKDDEGNGKFYDSPQTIGGKCPIASKYFELIKSDDVADQQAAKELSRKQYHFALVQIVQDKQNPELQGKIYIWRFPKGIMDKIEEQAEPSEAEKDAGIEPCNVFDPFEGKDFVIKVKFQGKWWNYDDCKFVDQRRAVRVLDENDELVEPVDKGEKGKEQIVQYLKEHSPDLSQFKYRPWSEEEKEEVRKILARVSGEDVNIDISRSKSNVASASEGSDKGTSTDKDDEPEEERPDVPAADKEGPKDEAPSEKKEEQNKKEDEGGDEDLEDFLKGLD